MSSAVNASRICSCVCGSSNEECFFWGGGGLYETELYGKTRSSRSGPASQLAGRDCGFYVWCFVRVVETWCAPSRVYDGAWFWKKPRDTHARVG